MNDAMIMFALATVVTLITTVFWRWVSSISQVQDKYREQIEAIRNDIAELRTIIHRDFQSKNESHRDNAQILEMLREIKADVTRLGEKMDRKADK